MRPPHGTAASFYLTPLGETAASLLRRRIERFWPDCARETVLGVGYPEPYRALWQDHARAVLAALPPGEHGVAPLGGTCLIDGKRLPFPDLSIDRVLLVHGLETAGNARRLLRETWRVLRDDGRLLIVAPNRAGFWAHADWTPFGQGEPYSPGQIARLLADAFFRVERFDRALHAPPVPWSAVMGAMPALDAAARFLAPGFAGVTLTEAVKDVFAAAPAMAPARVGGLAPVRTILPTRQAVPLISQTPAKTNRAGPVSVTTPSSRQAT